MVDELEAQLCSLGYEARDSAHSIHKAFRCVIRSVF